MNRNNMKDDIQSILFDSELSRESVVVLLDLLHSLINIIENKYFWLLRDCLDHKEDPML